MKVNTMDNWDTTKTMIISFAGAIMLLIIANILSFFIYASYEFTAKVESIDFYGRSAGFAGGTDKTIIRFDDGSVYNLYELPDGLKEEHTYEMEHQKPYFMGSERLVIVKEVE
jgi:hypothetical protein